MHIGICDDEHLELCNVICLLESYCESHNSNITFESFNRPKDLVKAMSNKAFDLLILDIIMPGQTGIELAKEIRKQKSCIPIIFLTTSTDFAIEGYQVQAKDYLIKPISKNLFFEALDKQVAAFSLNPKTIALSTSYGVIQVLVSSIAFIEAANRKLIFTMADGSTIQASGTIQGIFAMLKQYPYFYQAHRSYVVNFRFVKRIDKNGLYTLCDRFISVSRLNIAKIREDYIAYICNSSDEVF